MWNGERKWLHDTKRSNSIQVQAHDQTVRENVHCHTALNGYNGLLKFKFEVMGLIKFMNL